ncbi:MAG: SdpI family protein [Caldilineae bacterium]|nr:SdpI family protein [Chloroflexota bacterium]MCB9177514.1 SdpI family protein [Caldilineae bacterium]
MKSTWKLELPQLLVLALMFGLAAWTWPTAPDKVPVHWNLAGEVDRYGSRAEGLLILPGMALLIYVLLRALPRLDPRRENYARFAGSYTAMRLGILGLLFAIDGVMLLTLRGVAVDVGLVVGGLVGLLLVGLGMLLPRFQPNWFAGIRTPWTLSSDRVWQQTHALGGKLFVVMGLLVILAGLSKAPWVFGLAMGSVVLGSLGLVVYSYLLWRREQPTT